MAVIVTVDGVTVAVGNQNKATKKPGGIPGFFCDLNIYRVSP
jgi:hypothetical protein